MTLFQTFLETLYEENDGDETRTRTLEARVALLSFPPLQASKS